MMVQVSKEQAFAYAELLEILSFENIGLKGRIPEKLMNIFESNALPEYENHLNKNIPIDEQNISRKTASLLVLLSINYGEYSQEEKTELKEILSENKRIKDEEIRKKYKTDNIFEQTANQSMKKVIVENDNNLPMDYECLPWYKKVFNSIRNVIFKIIKK